MKYTVTLILLISINVFSQTPCVGGFAGTYPCNNLDLLSHIPLSTFGASRGNDSWGWTDPDTGKEYAIYGNTHNAAFIDISDPLNPVYLGKLNAHGASNTWRDIKVFNNYAFIVSEAFGHGIQIFDLTRLRNVANPPEIFTEDAHFNGFGSAHNIVINEDTGYAYGVGTNTYNGGAHFVNIQDPLNPVDEGGFADEGYTHDAQVVIYNGPDTDHTGKEIYFGANESSVVIVDVTNKANPVTISEITYSSAAYTHQLWIDENQVYLYCGDELDELNFGGATRNIIFDLTDLDNPLLHHQYFGTTNSIDHNNYVKGNKLYIANYSAGLRVVDVSDITNGNMNEIAYFDSYPANNSVNFDGVWNVYPFFESGNIMISDRDNGVFIVRDSNSPLSIDNNELVTTNLYPNPAKNKLTITSTKDINKIEVFNLLGKKIKSTEINNSLEYQLDVQTLNEGIYFIKINNLIVKKFVKQ